MKVEVVVEGEWTEIEFEKIQQEQCFRIYEDDGTLQYEGVAYSKPRQHKSSGNFHFFARFPDDSIEGITNVTTAGT